MNDAWKTTMISACNGYQKYKTLINDSERNCKLLIHRSNLKPQDITHEIYWHCPLKISCQRAIFCLLKVPFNLSFQGRSEQRIPMLKLFSKDAMRVMLSAAQ